MVLPSGDGEVLKIRNATSPDPVHKEIYASLKIPSEMRTGTMRLDPRTLGRGLVSALRVDPATLLGILKVVWQGGSGAVTLALIASYFTPQLQGYFFTFSSIAALQVFGELGLGQVIIQFASHEWSKLTLDERRRIVGSPEALSRLVSLGRSAMFWFALAGGIVAVGLGVAGYTFFSWSPQFDIRWAGPWVAFALLTGLSLWFVPIASLLEGCNQVRAIYFYRLVNGVLTGLSIWVAIVLGAALWAVVIATFVSLAWSAVFLLGRYGAFFRSFLFPPSGPRMGWRAEVWPMQWRIMLSWISGYFTFRLFTPVLFHYRGAIAAGQMGMTWALIGALTAMSSLWTATKVPQFGMLIAKKEYTALDRLFLRTTTASLVVALAGAGAIWLVIYLLYFFHSSFAGRILPPLPTGLLLAATVFMQISISESTYLRAHKKEPFLGLSVMSGVLIGASTWLLGRRFGATGIAAAYLAVVTLIVCPYGSLIWYRLRADWYSSPQQDL